MPLVSKAIPNLINGVSQQPDSLRLPSQAELQENLYSSVVEGLKDRPPTEHIAKIYTGTLGEAFQHTINRDATKRYNVLVTNGDLQVNGIDGAAKTVTFPDGKGYLTAAAPRTAFRAVTVADYTFLVNTTKVTAMASTTQATRTKEGLVFVKQGNYGSTYKVLVAGVVQATYTTSNTAVTDIATDNIAAQLTTQLTTNIGASYTITRFGSVIALVKISGDFTLDCTDAQGGTSLYAFKDTVASFTSLPTVATNNFSIGVTNSPGSESDNYYVQFTTNGATAMGEGAWNECAQQGLLTTLDAATMPFTLIRNVDDTFTFKKVVWVTRSAGDDLSAPVPSFIGATINETFFYKNRLAFCSDDNVILSGVGKYFNFFKTTVTTAVGDDPIDAPVNHTKVSTINHATPFDSEVWLFSDQTQFRLTGSPTLTAKTISILPITEFESTSACKPVSAGRRMTFGIEKGQYNGVREFATDAVTANKDAVDVAGHVPKYIPAGLFKMTVSTVEDMLVCLTTGDRTSLYVYKYFWAGQEKLQSAWFKLPLGDASTVIIGAEFIQTYLYLSIQRSDGVYYERMDFSPGAVDANVLYVTCLDRRITEAACTSVTYNAGTDLTTYTLPYVITGTMKIVTRSVSAGGASKTYTNPTTTTLCLKGDTTALHVWLGQTYKRRYILSTIYMRERTTASNSGTTVILDGRLQVRNVRFLYAKTGYFQVTVTPRYRTPRVYTFTGQILGAGSNLVGKVNTPDGEFAAPVLSKNDQVTIEVSSESHLPMHLLGAEWAGFYHAMMKRVT